MKRQNTSQAKGARNDITKVFVSYARRDREFVDRLVRALEAQAGIQVFRDTDDILPTEEWRARLGKLIGEADTIVFCLSPDSAASEVCAWEVAQAERFNKRMAPVVIRDVDGNVPGGLAKLNYLFFTERDDFDRSFQSLLAALRIDIDWIREHTRLGELSAGWQENGEPVDRLLRGADIAAAEAWAARRPREAPEPTDTTLRYIEASRAESVALERRSRRRNRLVTGASLLATLVMAALGWAMYGQWRAAELRQSLNLANYADQQVGRGNAVEGMLLAMEAMPDEQSAEPLAAWRPFARAALISLYRAFHAGSGKWHVPGHEKSVTSARISADREYVATASEDGTARVWEIATGLQQAVLVGHDGPITAMEFSPDGALLATGSADRTVRIWDWRSAKTPVLLVGHLSELKRLAFDPTGTWLLSVAEDKAVQVWAVATGEQKIVVPDESSSGFDQLGFTPDGSLLTVGGVLEKVGRIWDVSTGRVKQELHKVKDVRNARAEFSPDGKRLAVATLGRIRLLDAATSSEIAVVPAPSGSELWWSRFSPDGSKLAVRVDFGELTQRTSRLDIVDARSGRLICSTPTDQGAVLRFEFDKAGHRLFAFAGALTDRFRPLTVWDTSTCAEAARFVSRFPETETFDYRPGQSNFVVSSDGSRVVSWSRSRTAIWDSASGEEVAVVRADGRGRSWRTFAISPSAPEIAAFDEASAKVDIVDVRTGRHRARIEGHGDKYSAPLYAIGGKRLVVHDDHAVTIWDTASWRKVGAPVADKRQIYSVALSYDGAHVLVTYEAEPDDNAAEETFLGTKVARIGRVISADDGREVALRKGAEEWQWAQAISPDGKRDYRHARGEYPKIVDVATGMTVATLPDHYATVQLSGNKERLVTARDKTAWVWDFATGKQISELKGSSEAIFLSLAISQDGRRIITGPDFPGSRGASGGIGPDGRPIALSRDRSKALWLWDAGTGEVISALEGHTDSIEAHSMSADGRRIVTVSHDGTARVWSLETGALQAVLDVVGKDELVSRAEAHNAIFGPRGRMVVTLVGTKTVLWRLFPSPSALIDEVRAAVPRCLTPEERSAFFLAPSPPRWCYTMRKWPYHDHAKTPIPPPWYEKALIEFRDVIVTRFGSLREWLAGNSR